MKFDCSFLEHNKLLICHTVETVNGEKAICLQTNHLWIDKSPLSFYIIDLNSQIMITDDGETIFNLRLNGVIGDKRSWSLVRDKINCTHSDIGLSENGEIIAIANKDKLNTLLSDYISAMCSLMHYEYEMVGIPDRINKLAEEVELYLKAWKPQKKLTPNPKIKGISNHEYNFDFEIDNELILAINPTPNAVGAVMRKVGDVVSGSQLNGRKIMVIVDNRGDDLFNQKAIEEIKIISSLAKALPLTNLIDATKKSSTAH